MVEYRATSMPEFSAVHSLLAMTPAIVSISSRVAGPFDVEIESLSAIGDHD